MQINALDYDLTVCQVNSLADVDMTGDILFIGKTDEELSVVCRTDLAPGENLSREDGWKGFRIQGVLDFSLVGILAKISTLLADHQISIFALSTYNTDYVLVKQDRFEEALRILGEAGYEVV